MTLAGLVQFLKVEINLYIRIEEVVREARRHQIIYRKNLPARVEEDIILFCLLWFTTVWLPSFGYYLLLSCTSKSITPSHARPKKRFPRTLIVKVLVLSRQK